MQEEIVLPILWVIPVIVGIVALIISLIQKSKYNLSFWGGFTLIALTPFGMAITIIGFVVGIMLGPEYILKALYNRITKNWKDG